VFKDKAAELEEIGLAAGETVLILFVTNLVNGRSVRARINDRGPSRRPAGATNAQGTPGRIFAPI
jgi:hypothetical protein